MLSIRKVEEKDREIIFNWGNDPDTRAFSGNSNPLDWNEHVCWFKKKIQDQKNNYLYLILKENCKICFVRFEKKDHWYVGIVMSPEFRGQGLGKLCLKMALNTFEANVKTPIFANIKTENTSSLKIFLYNDFIITENEAMLTLRRD